MLDPRVPSYALLELLRHDHALQRSVTLARLVSQTATWPARMTWRKPTAAPAPAVAAPTAAPAPTEAVAASSSDDSLSPDSD